MSAGHRAVIEPSKRLPQLSLPSLPDGTPVPLRRPGRRAPVLLLVHGGECEACAAFAGEVAAAAGALADWDGYATVIRPDADRPAGGGLTTAVDAEGRAAAALAVAPPAVVVADQWGEIHQRYQAGAEHAFPPVAELIEWMRFLAIQCPECQAESF